MTIFSLVFFFNSNDAADCSCCPTSVRLEQRMSLFNVHYCVFRKTTGEKLKVVDESVDVVDCRHGKAKSRIDP